MVRLSSLPDDYADELRKLALPMFESTPWVAPVPMPDARVALVSTAGLHRRGDREFSGALGDYRIIPDDLPPAELVMSHASVNFDRSGFFADLNVVFPLELLHDLAASGEIGSVARWHYSFMGATPPERMQEGAADVARRLHEDGVTAALLVPV